VTVAAGHQPYAGQRVALVSQHGKQAALAEPLQSALGAELVVLDDVDTDAFGTFTRDVPRAGSQREAARRKAAVALERGYALAVGSEGAFVPGPFGFGAFDVELLVFVDAWREIEVVGQACEPGRHHHGTARTPTELAALAAAAGFPSYGLVVRSDDEHGPCVRKGLRTWDELHAAFAHALAGARHGRVFVENDLRAHQHPERMATIGKAALDLVERLGAACPACATPGFGRVGRRVGRPCAWCAAPTGEPLADELACVRCDHRVLRPLAGPAFADPGRCDRCNP
jgi:hypothetical protein